MYGGVEALLVTLARSRHLCPSMEPHFALSFEGRLSGELTAVSVPLYLLGKVRISRPASVWRARRSLRKVLRGGCFDIVICHMPWSLLVFGKAAQAEGCMLGFWAHGFHTGRGWLERLARRVKPDLAIGNSVFTLTGLANLFPKAARGVVHPPVAGAESAEAIEWRRSVREEMRVSEDSVVILQVSRLEAWKGHLPHLQALSLLKERTGWVCWIVGGPQTPQEEEYLRVLKGAAVELGIADRVLFLGKRADVPKLLAAADIFCQPNQEPEPFGIVFVEALWAGRPVVTTAMGGALEIIDDSCGVLVEPGNRAQLAEVLRRLIESTGSRAPFQQTGPARAQSICDPASQMGKLEELSRRVIAVGRRVSLS